MPGLRHVQAFKRQYDNRAHRPLPLYHLLLTVKCEQLATIGFIGGLHPVQIRPELGRIMNPHIEQEVRRCCFGHNVDPHEVNGVVNATAMTGIMSMSISNFKMVLG